MKKDAVKEKKPFGVWLKNFIARPGVKSVMSSLICILGGFVVGFIVLFILSVTSEDINFADSFKGLLIILGGPFSAGNRGDALYQLGNMLFSCTPLIMTGLSVALAFKTGLFNIGAPGQYLMGAMGSLLVALSMPTNVVPPILVWLLALLTGIAFGMIWGMIPGLFKGLLGVNEVIVCIMTNWIAANIVSWVFAGSQFINVAETKMNFIKKTAANNVMTPTLGLEKLFSDGSLTSYMDISIFIAVAIAVVLYIMLNKTTFGFELKACGFNKNASKYAGMNEKRNIMLSMAIAGGLAACGAALWCLNGHQDFKWEVYQSLPDVGFNGIPAALLGGCNPIGTVFSAIFLRYISAGGSNLTGQTAFNEYVSQLIIAIIIYFAGFSKFIKDVVIDKWLAGRKKKHEASSADAKPGDGGKEV